MKLIISFFVFGLFCLNAVAQTSITDSLIAWYPLNGNVNDSTANGNSGIMYGGRFTTNRFGNPNSALDFNDTALNTADTNDYVTLTGNNKFKPTTFPVSACGWVKYRGKIGQAGMMFANDETENNYLGIFFQIAGSGQAQISFGDGGPAGISDRQTKVGTTILDTNWHFIAGVIRGPQDMDIYLDCQNDGGTYTGYGGNLAYDNSPGVMGRYDFFSSGGIPYFYMRGIVDDVRFYNRELTQQDIQQLYSYPKPYTNLTVSLGNDIVICTSSTIDLVILTAVTTGDVISYNWSNNATADSIIVSQTGDYSVTVYDGCSYASDTVHVTYTSCNGINEVNAGQSLNMTYNADTKIVQIQNLDESNDGEMLIDVYNCIGQKVNPNVATIAGYKSTFKYHLPQNLSAGIYIVRVRSGNTSKALPVLVQ